MTMTTPPTYVHTYPPHGKVVEDSDEYIVELDVTEFTRDELDVSLDGDVVTLIAEQRRPRHEALTLCERLEESFLLPPDACADELSTQFNAGTLELHIPRRHFAVNAEATPC